MSSPPVVQLRAGGESRDRVRAALASGAVVVIPGTGSYLLAAAAGMEGSVEVFGALVTTHALGEQPTLVVGRTDAAMALAAEWSDDVKRLTERMWPGPLTVVLEARPGTVPAVAAAVAGSEEEGAVRVNVPAHRLWRRVSDELGPLVVAPMRGPDGGWLTTVTAVQAACADGPVVLVVDGGTLRGPRPTLIDGRLAPPVVRDEGTPPAQFIEAVLLLRPRRKWFNPSPR